MDTTESRTLDELLSAGDTLMVGTHDGAQFSSRPLTVARLDDDVIRILMDRTADWATSLTGAFAVHVTLSDQRDSKWVSMNGRGEISDDRAMIDELWNPAAAAFFDDGKETPGVAAMSITVTDGEYWSSASGRLGSLFTMLRAKLGDAEQVGERGDVDTTS